MNRFMRIAMCIVAGALVSGCGPSMRIYNSTPFPVMATFTQGKHRETFQPSPSQYSTVDVDVGRFRVYAVRLRDWLAYAKLTQKVLNDSLADPSRLTPAQINDIVQRMKDIADRIQQYQGAGDAGAGCNGNVSEKVASGNGPPPYVDIQVRDGRLYVGCF